MTTNNSQIRGAQDFGRHLSSAAFGLGIAGTLLWLVFYAWLPFRSAEPETETARSIAVLIEAGALTAAFLCIVTGAAARRLVARESDASRKAASAIELGSAVWFCLALYNLTGIFFFS